jgi:hypothetical protein
MLSSTDEALRYYSEYGIVTNPGDQAGLYENLPSDISQLCSIIHGLLLHVFWADRYGEKLSEGRVTQAGIRHVEKILASIQETTGSPIDQSRELDNRFVGNCRTFSVLLGSMLQYQGIPARARCGFGRYFKAGWHEDHWICEYWNDAQARWMMVDAQLDDFQCQELDISFNPLDVPRDQFIVGGKAWLACRNGETDPNDFGIFDMRGLWFIRGNLIRDIAALNKVELLPWDGWGLIDREEESISQEELILLDEVASKTFDEVDYSVVRDMYETNEGLFVPSIIKTYTQSGTLEIELSTGEVIE